MNFSPTVYLPWFGGSTDVRLPPVLRLREGDHRGGLGLPVLAQRPVPHHLNEPDDLPHTAAHRMTMAEPLRQQVSDQRTEHLEQYAVQGRTVDVLEVGVWLSSRKRISICVRSV